MSDTTPQQPSKLNGQYHSIKGTVVEVIGNLFGWASWTQSGKEEHAAGEAEITAAQAEAFAEGTIDRIVGRKDAIVGAIAGDKAQQIAGMCLLQSNLVRSTNFWICEIGNAQHDKGKAEAEANAPA
ncbi:hypothetical protein FRC08_010632 [Ceratobasidium sp. 394]|nr:hypothetical protein FRC08_010632 [Ceratobasidium sp. 394]